jgi:hypothetical protein
LQDETGIQLFQEVARQVYRNDPVWVPQSESLFLKTLKTAESGTQVLPLVAAENGLPRRVLVLQVKRDAAAPGGHIALFECIIDAPEAARVILAEAEHWLATSGIHHVQAPRLDNLLMGLLVKGFDLPQTVLTPHNPSYYPALLESAGYHPIQRMVTYNFNRRQAVAFKLALPGIHIRCFDRSRLDEEILVFNTLQNEIFTAHPGYVPRTLAEDRALIEGFLPMLDDELIIIAEQDGAGHRPVGLPAGRISAIPRTSGGSGAPDFHRRHTTLRQ